MSKKDPERPACGACGKPAHVQVAIDVQELEVHEYQGYGPGVKAARAWGPAMRPSAQHVRQVYCKDCARSLVQIDAKVSAKVNLQ